MARDARVRVGKAGAGRLAEIALADYKTDFPPNTVNRTLKLHFKQKGIRRLLRSGRLAPGSDRRMAMQQNIEKK
jgi:hypothetical protein